MSQVAMETTPTTAEAPSVDAAATSPATTEAAPQQAGASEAQPSSLLAANQSDWTTGVPDKFKTDGSINHEAIFKSYDQLEKKVGRFGLPPEAADKYEFSPLSADGKPIEVSEDGVNALKAAAHENGFTQKQFEFMGTQITSMVDKVWDHFATETGIKPEIALERAEATLKEAWGKDFESNQALAQKAFAKYDNGKLDAESLGRNADVMMLLASIGKDLGEDKGAVGSLPPSEDLEKLFYSPNYQNPNHPDHGRAKSIINSAYSNGWQLPKR